MDKQTSVILTIGGGGGYALVVVVTKNSRLFSSHNLLGALLRLTQKWLPNSCVYLLCPRPAMLRASPLPLREACAFPVSTITFKGFANGEWMCEEWFMMVCSTCFGMVLRRVGHLSQSLLLYPFTGCSPMLPTQGSTSECFFVNRLLVIVCCSCVTWLMCSLGSCMIMWPKSFDTFWW